MATANGRDSSPTISVGITDNGGTSIGLTFAPPNGEGWSEERSGLGVTLSKNPSPDDHREIEAYLTRLDTPASPISDYIETIKRNIERGYANSNELKVVHSGVTEAPMDGRCAMAHLLLEVRKPSQAALEKTWSEQYVLSCGFLKHKGWGVELRYHHRYTDSRKDAQLAEDVRRLFASVMIEDS